MRDQLLMAGGALGAIVAIVHGVLGETHVFARARIEPQRLALLIRLVWQCSALAWAGIGALLIAAPFAGSERARHAIIVVGIGVWLAGVAGNAYATRLRHPGWVLLLAACGLAAAGW